MEEAWLSQGGVVAEALGELLFSRVLPFLGWAGTYRGAPVSRTWRDGVDADARRELRRLARAARHVVGGVERGAGAGLFPEPLGEGDLASWEAALRAHAGPGGNGRVVALPSHVRALLRTVGASRVASASGYARTAANTLRPLGDWRLVRDLYAYFEYRRPFIFESADWPHPPAPEGCGWLTRRGERPQVAALKSRVFRRRSRSASVRRGRGPQPAGCATRAMNGSAHPPPSPHRARHSPSDTPQSSGRLSPGARVRCPPSPRRSPIDIEDPRSAALRSKLLQALDDMKRGGGVFGQL